MGAIPEPAFDRADVSITDGVLQHVVREAVDLHKNDPGDVGGDGPATLGLPPDDLAVVEVVVIDGQERRDDRVDEGEADGNRNARPDAVNLEAVDHLRPEI